MRKLLCLTILIVFLCPPISTAENMVSRVKKAVERSTLNQPGTKPFRLKATIAPSFDRDKDSGRTGAVEVWWASPIEWKREVRSPEFHQIEIINNGREWQKNEGNYFPEWLRETAAELINPVPPLDEVLEHVKTAETKSMMNQVNVDWTTTTGTAEVKNIQRTWIALDGTTGLLLYGGGFGWDGEFKNYKKFNGRMIAQTVKGGSPEVTATVTTLEDLESVPTSFFDTNVPGGDPQPLSTELIDEPTLRKNMLPTEPIIWPTLQDGSLEGNVTTWIVIDREGKVREMQTVVSENSGVNEAGKNAIANLRFKPFLVNGVPVQAMSQITMPFKTTRPAGTEHFDSARNYFERGRKVSFPLETGRPM
jgi:Gram-negative bacterial TonB protein C-terminal